MLAPLLFSEFDMFSVMEHQKKSLKDAVDAAPESFASMSDDDVVAEFAKRFEVEVPTLLRDRMSMPEEEIDEDVSRDPRRMIFDRSGPFFMKATKITVHVQDWVKDWVARRRGATSKAATRLMKTSQKYFFFQRGISRSSCGSKS